MKVVFIKHKDRWFWPGVFTKWFTGCSFYHVGFLADSGYFYDMNYMRQRQLWTDYIRPSRDFEMFHCNVKESFLERRIMERKEHYGIADYFSFVPRWLGFKVKNRKGLICSEQVNNDLREHYHPTPWKPNQQPPSPCDLHKYFRSLNGQD